MNESEKDKKKLYKILNNVCNIYNNNNITSPCL